MKRSFLPVGLLLAVLLLPILALTHISPLVIYYGMKQQPADDAASAAPQEETPANGPLTELPDRTKVVIDAGHGGDDPGSTGVSNNDEKWLTLSIALKVHQLLASSATIEPIMIRIDDSSMTPRERAEFANGMEADLYVSIHANSYKGSRIRGTETYYYHDDSRPLAELLHRRIVEATGFPDRGVRNNDYIVVTETKMPSALLEIGYLSNPDEEAALLDDNVQDRIAEAIVQGIEAYLQGSESNS